MLWIAKLPANLAVALLVASWIPPLLVAASPSVNVAMKAAFPAPPYLVELLEAASPENTTCYFALLDYIAKGHFADARTDKALYDKFVETLQQDGHMDAETLSIFKLALSLRSAAPRVEAHYQFYTTAIEGSVSGDQEGCDNWLWYNKRQYCSADLKEPTSAVLSNNQERALPFDRVVGPGPDSLILYADIASPAFAAFHKLAMDLLTKSQVSYRIRYKRGTAREDDMLAVNGYGVELALKRTDYIVIDDRTTDAASLPIDEAQKVVGPRLVLDEEEEVADIKPLEKSELSSLGMKAGSFIMQSKSPFETLLKLTQDFPKFSTSLGGHNVSVEFASEHEQRLGSVPAGMNVLWMNGVQLIDRQIQPFGLVDLLRRERKLIQGVLELGFTGQEAVSLLGHSEVAEAKSDVDLPRRFDWRDEIEAGSVIIWLNNIEKDKRYERWPPNLFGLLQSIGSPPQVRRDIFTLVVPVDLSKMEDLVLVLEKLLAFVNRLVPVRFGLVPLTSTPEAAQQAKVVYHLLKNSGLEAMSTYLQSCLDRKKAAKANEDLFNKVVKDAPLRNEATRLSLSEVLSSDHYDKQIGLAKHWVDRLHAGGEVPTLFFDGFAIPRDQNWLKVMNQKMGMDLQMLQQAVYFGMISEHVWIPGHLLDNAIVRRNTLVFPEDPQELTVLNMNKLYTEHWELFSKIPTLAADEASSRDDWATLSVIADFSNAQGQKLLYHALDFRREHAGARLDILHNPAGSHKTASRTNARLRAAQDSLLDLTKFSDLDKLLESQEEAGEDRAFDAALAGFLASANIGCGDSMLMLNGRIVGPVPSADDFTKEDLDQFLATERTNRILPVYKAMDDLGLSDRVSGPLAAAKLSSVTALSGISDLPQGIFGETSSVRTTIYKDWSTAHTSFEVGDAMTASIHLVALLNPASELGQKWAPILKVLSDLEGVHLRVFLNPKPGLSELPVKRFYRYVLDSAPSFDHAGKVESLSATFNGIPSDTLLIAGMDVPPAWLVSAKVAVDDLDNLKIKDIQIRRNTDRVEAIYELEKILIEGHSRELPSGSAPRGVQLVLETDRNPHVTDTIIMANLGYFQFKANPGLYNIKLKKGRSSHMFEMQSVGSKGWAAVPGDDLSEIALMDFQGSTLYPRLVRKAGMEDQDVLTEQKSGLDFVSSGFKIAQSMLGAAHKDLSMSDKEHGEINIFSVASGHLYERMLNIMMVSVVRHTNHTVKFWFIEQFLSPSFKDFIPHLAEEYGFQYEMVTYKWPHWLRGQKEKQREIWGYKILFLDVLFPLSLDKVIFVDADQIVRTDMYDLVQLDLKGAPYGFTPMCDSRTEMEGFRFWKTGYWQTYLKGLPYHISALYVVDLRRFRELAAGDRLRQQYHTLSADPNSLSNLDQDLPNHMQFTIPIHSLPQEWLWCETWCSGETLAEARTIDLCNNPQTKEPKLERARRQVPEWTVYDDEIAAVNKRRGGKERLVGTGTQEDDQQAEEVNPTSRRLDDDKAARKQVRINKDEL